MITSNLSCPLLLASAVLLSVFGCTPSKSVPNEPGQVTPGPASASVPSFSGVQLPASIRKGAWYTGIILDGYGYHKYRYRFTDAGADYQRLFSEYLFRKADGTYFILRDHNLSRDLSSHPRRMDLAELGVTLGPGADAESVKADLERVAIAKSGDWVTIVSRAAIESTENTVSISWAEVDKNLAILFDRGDQTERLRIEDDGLKLVRIDNEEIYYILD